jgi:15-cis-phytoene synthase
MASAADYAECERLHKAYGSTYYYATRWFPREVRPKVHALYGFVRVPDEWVDNPEPGSDVRGKLQDFRRQLVDGYQGITPTEPCLRAFCDTALESNIPISEPLCFLDAMEQDIDKLRYKTYTELEEYMRGSAAAVGVMMCYILGASNDPKVVNPAVKLGEAMQMTNFLRDVGEDTERKRIYLPQDDMARFGITDEIVFARSKSDAFVDLLKFEIQRTRQLYRAAEAGLPNLPVKARKPVRLALELYEMILDKVEKSDYDVLQTRARTTKHEKLWVAIKILCSKS